VSTRTEKQIASGAALYEKAKRLIPGGVHLLSKSPERLLPEQWPVYFSRAKGCHVWDLDEQRYTDMLAGGGGSCLLGVADPDVDAAVKQVISKGSMATLNPPEEVELAELLCDIHPWAGMARFTRSGGEADAVAVRIARAYTGRDLIAFCGYHGWHDWYIAANLAGEDNLDGHLLRGLKAAGVPQALAGTILPFRFNHIEDLDHIEARHGNEIGTIIMEPMRFEEPKDEFLEKVRDVADRLGAVLIFDEISIGWRHCLGGLHLQLNVDPDIVVYGKVISNGFPMGAVVGREGVMQAAQDAFISSTYFTDRIGPAAALATIQKMREADVWQTVRSAGQRIQEAWSAAGDANNLNVQVAGRPGFCSLAFDYGDDSDLIRSLYTQEMLDRKYLAGAYFYPSLAHDDKVIDAFLRALDRVFATLADAVREGDAASRLRGPAAASDFRRLT